ncbi:hypothetical protein CH275_18880 [Rhodococcus sp. 06-235-1A]|uniref:hypothetical protein n=1 Tax=Rhodococcus sp. 06-235-1A TaxID=2022508 RepID=UPI000BC50CC9|nr:hypothetical protein [Rhodococcus sp. 06-235-1A]OZD01855.1 hypothetical protein CH275_18880 [Rhodococcus sp. 06-235-1A]
MTLIGWVGVFGSTLVVGAVLLILATGNSDVAQKVLDFGPLLPMSAVVLVVTLTWLLYLQSLEVMKLSRVGVTTIPSEALRSRWGSSTLGWLVSLMVCAVCAKGVGTQSFWFVDFSVLAIATVTGLWCGYRSTRGLSKTHRRAMSAPPLFVDGILSGRPDSATDSSMWKKLGPDWVNPQSIVRSDAAIRFADAADDRSGSLSIVGRWIPLPIVGFIATSFIWMADPGRSPASVAVPMALLGIVSIGYLVERRAIRLDRLAGEYRERARKILDKAPGSGAPISLWVANRRRTRGVSRRPMVRV